MDKFMTYGYTNGKVFVNSLYINKKVQEWTIGSGR